MSPRIPTKLSRPALPSVNPPRPFHREVPQSFLEWKPQIKLDTKSAIRVGDQVPPAIQIQLIDVAVVKLDLAVRALGEGRVVGDHDDRAALGPEVGE